LAHESMADGITSTEYGVVLREILASMCSAPPVREQTRLNLYIIPIPVRRVDWRMVIHGRASSSATHEETRSEFTMAHGSVPRSFRHI
jgi:hypothetical protein